MKATLVNLSKCYYASLNVPKDAPLEDIKASFRKMSKETHPDVATQGCPERNAERFKEISNAYQTLSNPKERRRYDLEQQDQHWYRNRQSGSGSGGFGSYNSGPYANSNMRPPPQGPKATGVYAVLETMFKPRNFVMGVTIGICTSVVYQFFFIKDDPKKLMHHHRHHASQLVEAWKNPKTGRWEQAAPWDPIYQRLKPTLEMVPREQVQKRTR